MLNRGCLRAGAVTALTLVATMTAMTAMTTPATAHADNGFHVSGTGGLGLARRSQPSIDSTRIATIPEGDALAIDCQTTGDDVFGSVVWDRLADGGYVSDWYVDPAEDLVSCAASDGGISYDRDGAARWAVAHAFDPPDYDGADCANFVSAALHFGGGLEATDWWWQYSTNWIVASDLADAMAEHGVLTRTDIDPADSAIPGAEVGDVVLYDQGRGEGFHHVSIVVRVGASGVVEVASHTTAYDYRIWNQSWLDSDHPAGYRAQLLHLLTGVG
jgi:hypothetical protein